MLHIIHVHTELQGRASMLPTSFLMRFGYSCHVVASDSTLSIHLAAFAPEPTNLLMPTLFAFFPLSCACIGCSFSHLSSSLYASTAASKSQSACCMYSVATSYLSVGGILVSLSVLRHPSYLNRRSSKMQLTQRPCKPSSIAVSCSS